MLPDEKRMSAVGKEVDAREGRQARARKERMEARRACQWNRQIRLAAHTSSRASACLNTRIVVFTPTKGKVLPMMTPTLATVSLLIKRLRLGVLPSGYSLEG